MRQGIIWTLVLLLAAAHGGGQTASAPRPAAPPASAATAADVHTPLSEEEKIEALITSFKQLAGASFIRNGKHYDLNQAISHLRQKWTWKQSRIQSASDFITHAGSRSTVSGKPYVIRLADGSEITSEAWFVSQLTLVESNAAAARAHMSHATGDERPGKGPHPIASGQTNHH